MRYSVEPRDQYLSKAMDFSSFVKNIGKPLTKS